MKLLFVISLAVLFHLGSTILYGRYIQVQRLPYVIPCTMVWKYNYTEYKPGNFKFTSRYLHNFTGLVIARNLIITQGQFFAVGTEDKGMSPIGYPSTRLRSPYCWPLRSALNEFTYNFECLKFHLPGPVKHHYDAQVAILQATAHDHVTFGQEFHMAPLPLQDSAKNALPPKGKIVYAAGFGSTIVTDYYDNDHEDYIHEVPLNLLGAQRFQVVSDTMTEENVFLIGPLPGEKALPNYGDHGGPVFTPEDGVIGIIRLFCPPLQQGDCEKRKAQAVTLLAPYRTWIDNIRTTYGKFDNIGDSNY